MRRIFLLSAGLVLAGLISAAAYREVTHAYSGKTSVVREKEVPEIQIPAETRIHVRLNQTLDTARNRSGDSFSATLDSPVTVNGAVVVPEGTTFRGHLTAAKPSGRLKGRGYMSATLDSFELKGQTYPVKTSLQSRTTGSHKKRNWGLIGGGTGLGALVGGLAGGGKGLLIGGGAGAAAGTAGAAITGRKQVRLPVETPMTFRLQEPVLIKGPSVS
jgi:hypothetical protein